MHKGYGKFIIEKINEMQEGVPIFTDEVTDLVVREYGIDYNRSRSIVNTNLNRISGKTILNYRKGIYYRPKTTVFGKAPLNPMQVIARMYLRDGNTVIGYETGASLLHQLGLTTQIPKFRYIATNKYQQKGNRVIEDMKVVIRRPNTVVNRENFLYLQLLDAVENRDGILADAQNPSQILNDYIIKNQLDYGKLIGIAAKNYNRESLLRVADLAVKTRL